MEVFIVLVLAGLFASGGDEYEEAKAFDGEKGTGFRGIHVCLCVRILSRVCVDSYVGCALRILSAPHFLPEPNLRFLEY